MAASLPSLGGEAPLRRFLGQQPIRTASRSASQPDVRNGPITLKEDPLGAKSAFLDGLWEGNPNKQFPTHGGCSHCTNHSSSQEHANHHQCQAPCQQYRTRAVRKVLRGGTQLRRPMFDDRRPARGDVMGERHPSSEDVKPIGLRDSDFQAIKVHIAWDGFWGCFKACQSNP